MTNKGVIRGLLPLLLVVGLATGAVVATASRPALSPVAQDSNTQMKDKLKAALLVTLDKTNKAMKIIESQSLDTTISELIRKQLKKCKPKFIEGTESAQATLSDVSKMSNADVHKMVLQDLVRITQVITITQECGDNLESSIYDLSGTPSLWPQTPAHDVEVYEIVQTQLKKVSNQST